MWRIPYPVVLRSGLAGAVLLSPALAAAVPGVSDGIPEPDHRNVIVQLFNWRFADIEDVLPTLADLGYSHIHVSPPQKSNEHVWQWWGRYQPVDFYDFPLTRTMRQAFAFGGDLRILKDPAAADAALPGPEAVTFVRNHDVDRGQADDRGLEGGGRDLYGVGWNEASDRLDRTDVRLAYAYLFGREDGFPYVFVDMNTLPAGQQDDRFDDPMVVAGIRFHNLSLGGQGGVDRRPEIWRIETQNAIGWQRGDDRFVVINKAAEPYEIVELPTSLQTGTYQEIRTGWPLHVQPDGRILHWRVPGRSAMFFVRVGDL